MRKEFHKLSSDMQMALIRLPTETIELMMDGMNGMIHAELTINGVEVDLEELMNALGQHLDEYIENKAKDLIQEKAYQLDNAVFDLYESVTRKTMEFRETVDEWSPHER